MEKWYVEKVEKILAEVKRVLMDEVAHATGAEIVVSMKVGQPDYVSYTIKEKVVK